MRCLQLHIRGITIFFLVIPQDHVHNVNAVILPNFCVSKWTLWKFRRANGLCGITYGYSPAYIFTQKTKKLSIQVPAIVQAEKQKKSYSE